MGWQWPPAPADRPTPPPATPRDQARRVPAPTPRSNQRCTRPPGWSSALGRQRNGERATLPRGNRSGWANRRKRRPFLLRSRSEAQSVPFISWRVSVGLRSRTSSTLRSWRRYEDWPAGHRQRRSRRMHAARWKGGSQRAVSAQRRSLATASSSWNGNPRNQAPIPLPASKRARLRFAPGSERARPTHRRALVSVAPPMSATRSDRIPAIRFRRREPRVSTWSGALDGRSSCGGRRN